MVAAASLLLSSAAAAGCSTAPAGEPPRADASRADASRAESTVTWHPPAVVGDRPLRAFTPNSWWNRPVPSDAPTHPRAAEILTYMATAERAGGGCLRLAGTPGSPWGQPVYWAQAGDPSYDVAVDVVEPPPELRELRIPRGARAAENSDGSMTVFDVEKGYVVAFTDALHDPVADTWRASGATVTYLDSNGLHADTGRASDPRNVGSHRGNNAAVMMVRLDEVQAGRVDHVVKVASGPEVSTRFAFPMVGSDGASTDPAAPPQGLRFRIKPSVDVDALGLDRQTEVIAKGLQEYGFYIGDSAGATSLKLEDTRLQGRRERWSMPPTALCGLPLSTRYWDVLPEGYWPPA